MAYSGAGAGTIGDPYIITDIDQLNEVRDHYDCYWELGNDIDASATQLWDGGQGWLGIGSFASLFILNLDGKGYTIDGLYINRPNTDYQAIFGGVHSESTIKNLNITNIFVSGKYRSGLLAGFGEGIYSNIHVQGEQQHNDTVAAGIISRGANATISDCSVDVVIGPAPGKSATTYVGGIVGYQAAGSITRCYAKGALNGGSHRIGGLVGHIVNVTIEDCYSNVYIEEGGTDKGGLIGYVSNDTGVPISRCYSNGYVGESTSNIGGLIGIHIRGVVEDSYWDTETSGAATSQAAGEGKTTAEMKAISTYNPEWNIVEKANYVDETWYIDEGVDYPRLGWEYEEPVTDDRTVSGSLVNKKQTSSSTAEVKISSAGAVVNKKQIITAESKVILSVSGSLVNKKQVIAGSVTAEDSLSASGSVVNNKQTASANAEVVSGVSGNLQNNKQAITGGTKVIISASGSLVNKKQVVSGGIGVALVIQGVLVNKKQISTGEGKVLLSTSGALVNKKQIIDGDLRTVSGFLGKLRNNKQTVTAEIKVGSSLSGSLVNGKQIVSSSIEVEVFTTGSLVNKKQTVSADIRKAISVSGSLQNSKQTASGGALLILTISGGVINKKQNLSARIRFELLYELYIGEERVLAAYFGETLINDIK